jgi:hypothetical protein
MKALTESGYIVYEMKALTENAYKTEKMKALTERRIIFIRLEIATNIFCSFESVYML